MWTGIAITFLVILALIGLGAYIVARKAIKIGDKATKQLIKESFKILDKKINTTPNESDKNG